MEKAFYLLLAIYTTLLFGCKRDDLSVKKDLVSNSTVINVSINVDKSINTQGIVSNSIVLSITNTKGERLEIQDGWVKVNSIEMEPVTKIFEYEDYYSHEIIREIYKFYTSNLTVEENTLYDFEIKLSDGTIYNYSLTTREKDLYELNIPTTHSRDDALKISWKDISNSEKFYVSVSCFFNNQNLREGTYIFNETEYSNGEYIIPASYFAEIQELDSLIIEIKTLIDISKKEGNVSSFITSWFGIEKSCKIE